MPVNVFKMTYEQVPADIKAAIGVLSLRTVADDPKLAYVDLSYVNFSRFNLSGLNLAGYDLHGANLSLTNLSSSRLNDSVLSGADMAGVYAVDTDMTDAIIGGLSQAAPYNSNKIQSFYYDNTIHTNMRDAQLLSIDLAGANMVKVDLTDAFLTSSNISNADLTFAILKDAYLTGSNLKGSNLTKADLTGAFGVDLTGTVDQPTG